MPDRQKHVERRLVIGLLLLGLLLRVTVAALAIRGPYNPDGRLGGDTAKYLSLALSLSHGEGYSKHYAPSLKEVIQGRPLPETQPVPTASRSPGYPLFLAVVFSTLGVSLRGVLFLQAFLSTLTAWLIYLTARELRARPLLALSFAVFYYPFAFEAVYVMGECLFTFCTAAFLWLIVRSRSELMAGVAAGISVLVKSVTFPFLVIAPFLLKDRRVPIFLIALAAVVAPWGYRNYLHTGVPYLTPSYGGEVLYLLHNPWNRDFPTFNRPGDINEYFAGFQEAVTEAKSRAPQVADPVAREYLEDLELRGEALRFMRSDPSQAVRAVWRSFANTWRLDYPHANPVRWVSNLILYFGLLPFAAWGAIQAIRRGPSGARLLVVYLVYFIVVSSLFISEIRYRTSAMPAYFVLAAYGISALRRPVAPNHRFLPTTDLSGGGALP